jgi:hypothetical protein
MARFTSVVFQNTPAGALDDLFLLISKILPRRCVALTHFRHEDGCLSIDRGGIDNCSCDPIPEVEIELEGGGEWEVPEHLVHLLGIKMGE